MVLDPRETIMSVEHYAATLISHELAHKWFGNLITCYWWSNTWINEGFASYFGYIATYEVTDANNSIFFLFLITQSCFNYIIKLFFCFYECYIFLGVPAI